MTVDELLEIEEIRKLRMLYSYYLDAADVAALSALFTEDAVCEFGPYGTWRGRNEIQKRYMEVEKPAIEKGGWQSLHANTNLWIELLGPDTAVGRVYLIDLVLSNADANPLTWLGVYDEDYKKVRGKWKIARSSLQFMWPKRHVSAGFPGTKLPSKS